MSASSTRAGTSAASTTTGSTTSSGQAGSAAAGAAGGYGVNLLVGSTVSPADTTPVHLLQQHTAEAADIVAVVGKSEGNGCVNDFSRTLAALAWEPLLSAEAVTVFSGGTEGVLSPHVNLLVRDQQVHPGHDRGLVAAAGRTGAIAPADLGRLPQVHAVAAVVRSLIEQLAVSAEDVHLVLVKCPLLTSERMATVRAAGQQPVTDDTYESMAHSRAASSLGIALALGECTDADVLSALEGSAHVWSERASASAGAELEDCHVMVLAVSRAAANPLRAVHGAMADAIDIASVQRLLEAVRTDGGELVQIFAKAEADPSGRVRGQRHTMLTDSDINSTRHARAAVGGLLAALRGDPRVYVSGGAEHQGPPGGGSITLVYRVPGQR